MVMAKMPGAMSPCTKRQKMSGVETVRGGSQQCGYGDGDNGTDNHTLAAQAFGENSKEGRRESDTQSGRRNGEADGALSGMKNA